MVLLSKVQFVALHGSDDRQSVSEVLRRVESVVTGMAEYIDKDIAVKGLRMAHDVDGADFVENIPAADVRENVKAEWELHGGDDDLGGYYFCSNCHAGYDEDWFYVHDEYHPFAHCPCCGAEMGGAEDG